MKNGTDNFHHRICSCLVKERRGLGRLLQRIGNVPDALKPELSGRFQGELEAAEERKLRRTAAVPRVIFSGELPIHAHHDEIAKALSTHQVLIVCGETGSGKSTQLPKLCLSLGLGVNGWIGHTQPRRLAARTIANRLSEELECQLGGVVGYKIRHTDKTSPNSYIKVMTDGILLSELQSDHLLEQYDTIIIDEAHERNLNIDFILGYLKRILPQRPDLKLIVTSATIDVERFSTHFDNAPVIEVSGRTYPVEVRYRPLQDADDSLRSREDALYQAVTELYSRQPGDILVFMEGEREIHEMADFLRKKQLPDTDILPLYARLGSARQNEIFRPHKRRHIVLATNVAETSLTIPAIHHVIDFGNARISRYSYRGKVQRLLIEKISQASAAQRQGRCGRIAAGICIRLYSEQDYEQRPAFTEAEVLRTNLAAVILRMKAMKIGNIEKFPFLEPPDGRFINDGIRLLIELGALSPAGHLTEIGRKLSRLPVDPRLGRMLLAANDEACLEEVLIIVSALSIQDPRERPLEAREKADEAHKQFNDERSDFLWFVNLWRVLFTGPERLTGNQLGKFCRRNFLSYLRLQEWREIHTQLRGAVRELGLRVNQEAAGYNNIHCALLPGLLSQVACKTDEREYTGARHIKLQLFPGSGQFKSRPQWIVAAELAQTSRLYARTVARIDPLWLLKPASALLSSQYSEPFWDAGSGQVYAYEKVSLYGLVLIPRRKINYGPVAPRQAREIFIRVLAEGRYQSPGRFQQENREIIDAITALERKARRPDILNEEAIYEFYADRIPDNIHSAREFERWRTSAEKGNKDLLKLSAGMIMYHAAGEISDENYPDILINNDVELRLFYQYDPGADDDGLSVEVPLYLLNRVDTDMFERLVPGLLEEKINALIKALPKAVRKRLVPVPDTARQCLLHLRERPGPLIDVLGNYLLEARGIDVPKSAWQPEALPDYLRINMRVLDESGKVLSEGRDVSNIKVVLTPHTETYFSELQSDQYSRDGITAWSIGDLPGDVEIKHNGKRLTAYPAIMDQGCSVSLRLLDTKEKADEETHKGLHRLFRLELSKDIKYLGSHLIDINKIGLLYSSIGSVDEIREDIIHASIERAFLAMGNNIRTQQAFDHVKKAGQKRLITIASEICHLTLDILELYQGIRRSMREGKARYHAGAIADIGEQLAGLIYPGFIRNTPSDWLICYPRYLDAIKLRLRKLEHSIQKDQKKFIELKGLLDSYQALRQKQGTKQMQNELQALHWHLEELRVSLFAQELKTVVTVSVPRLAKRLEALRNN